MILMTAVLLCDVPTLKVYIQHTIFHLTNNAKMWCKTEEKKKLKIPMELAIIHHYYSKIHVNCSSNAKFMEHYGKTFSSELFYVNECLFILLFFVWICHEKRVDCVRFFTCSTAFKFGMTQSHKTMTNKIYSVYFILSIPGRPDFWGKRRLSLKLRDFFWVFVDFPAIQQ